MHVSFAEAQQIIDSAVKKSQELNLKMCIAVLDSGGNIKAFARMDDAWIGSSDIAIKKAKTSVLIIEYISKKGLKSVCNPIT